MLWPARAGSGLNHNLPLGLCMGGRNPSTWAITCCFLSTLSETEKEEQVGLEPGTPMWDGFHPLRQMLIQCVFLKYNIAPNIKRTTIYCLLKLKFGRAFCISFAEEATLILLETGGCPCWGQSLSAASWISPFLVCFSSLPTWTCHHTAKDYHHSSKQPFFSLLGVWVPQLDSCHCI